MWLTYTLFLIGFYLLLQSASWLINGASAIAKKWRVSNLMIGLTIVAFGTSAPELIVNVIASLQGSSHLAVGNIIGSNIANVLLILGVCALIYPLRVGHGTVWKEIPLSLLAAFAVWLLVNDSLIDNFASSALTRIDGGILLLFFIIFIYYTFGIARVEGEGQAIASYNYRRSILMVLGGIVGLFIGGKWIVDGAIFIAAQFGMSESLVGLTIVAIGTSLPELATSAVAAWKKHSDLAIGNIIGSNIFNIFWILGLSALLRPLAFDPRLNLDIYFMVIITILLFSFMFIGKKFILQRWQGAVMVLCYIIYLSYLIIRG